MTTGELLKKYRKARGLTQIQFAEQLSVSTVTYNRLERDIIEPSGGVLNALSAVLAKDEMDELLNTMKSSGSQNVATTHMVDRLSTTKRIAEEAEKNISSQFRALGWDVLFGRDYPLKETGRIICNDLIVFNSGRTKKWIINYVNALRLLRTEIAFDIFHTKANKFSVVLPNSQDCISFFQEAVGACENFNCDISLLQYDPELKRVIAEWEISTKTTGSGFFDLDSTDDEIRTAAERAYMAWKRSLNSAK